MPVPFQNEPRPAFQIRPAPHALNHPGARRATPPHLRRGVATPPLIQEGWRRRRRGGYPPSLSAVVARRGCRRRSRFDAPIHFCYKLIMQPVKDLRVVPAATRLENVRYAIRDMAVLAEQLTREGKTILPLNIGDPLKFDFQTPPHMIEAVHQAMRDGKNGYAPSPGVPEALNAVQAEAERNGIRNIQNIFMTAGASEAVDICLTALVNPGENILTPCPEYPLYSAVLAKLGIPLNPYQLDEGADWEPDIEDMESRINAGTRAILVINPNNPTGAVYSRKTLERIVELARRNHLVLLADEIYDKLILDGGPHTALASLAPDVLVVTFNGLSKSYLAPGWRVGWGIVSGNAEAVKPYVEGIHQLLRARLCSNHPQQYAVRPALEGSQDHLPLAQSGPARSVLRLPQN